MTSEKYIMLHQIFARLCYHAGLAPEEHASARAKFIASLMCYPEDLLCAGYHYVVRHITPAYYPNEGDFIAFMTPEYMRRQQESEQSPESRVQKNNALNSGLSSLVTHGEMIYV